MTPPCIEDLPDYPALRQVQEALWQLGETRGAAVMIGAGFSRFANLPADDSPLPPLWTDFANAMAERTGSGTTDPLLLADEYRAAMGDVALGALIRERVRDQEWEPGQLHRAILSLPWSDVLTTNWDTLLERTDPANPDRSYEVVRTVADIARTRAPRIVKLHGTLPSLAPFTFTAEQFRRYPTEFAPMVNLAQQVLLENELCLIGFSGDDPNFRVWAGWVRDQLGTAARPIRLIGVLNLTPARRILLQQQNITPIDLAPLVSHLPANMQHAHAAELLLASLKAAEPRPPTDWNLATIDVEPLKTASAEAQLAEILKGWRSDRASYPGWLVAPAAERNRLRWSCDHVWSVLMSGLNGAEGCLAAEVAAELIWRADVALWPLDEATLDLVARKFASGASLDAEARSWVLQALASGARRRRDGAAFKTYVERLEVEGDTDRIAQGAYQRGLWASANFDYPELEEQIEKMQGRDPVWGLRRATLLTLAHRAKEAAGLIRGALADVRARRSRDRRSIWLTSREAWALWLARPAAWVLGDTQELQRPANFKTQRFAEAECDPWDHLTSWDHEFHQAVEERRRDARPIRPRYDAGGYVDDTHQTRFVSHTAVSPLEELVSLQERVGIPAAMSSMELIAGRLSRALAEEPETTATNVWRAAATSLQLKDGLIDRYFSRIEVAQLPQDLVCELSARLRAAIEHACDQVTGQPRAVDWLETTGKNLEVLSRLIARLNPDEAIDHFRWGCGLAQKPICKDWTVFEPLDRFLARAIEAITPARRSEVVLDALKFPHPGERDIDVMTERWPQPDLLISHLSFQRDWTDGAWTHRINELISLVQMVRRNDILDRGRAAASLLQLHSAGTLTDAEQAAFASALWFHRRPTKSGLPIDARLLPHAFLLAPEPEPGLAAKAFRQDVITPLAQSLSAEALTGLRAAQSDTRSAAMLDLHAVDLLPIIEQAVRWRPKSPRGPWDFMGDHAHQNRRMSRAVGESLDVALLPALKPADLDPRLRDALVEAILSEHSPALLCAAAQGARLVPDRSDALLTLVRRTLAGRDEQRIAYALRAVLRSLEMEPRPWPIGDLATEIANVCAVRREAGVHAALSAARQLLLAGEMSASDRSRLVTGLEYLLAETAYEDWSFDDRRTITLTLIRKACVRLAVALKAGGETASVLQAWIDTAAEDPIPEVRFAAAPESED